MFCHYGLSVFTDVQGLHLRYGEVVHIAPDEISLAQTDAFQEIYSNAPGRPTFPKSKLWHDTAPGRPHSVLNALHVKADARFLEAMSSSFIEKAVRMQRPILQNHVSLFIDQLERLGPKEPNGAVVDIVRWFCFVGFDLVGDVA